MKVIFSFFCSRINDTEGESLGCKVSTKEELVSSD